MKFLAMVLGLFIGSAAWADVVYVCKRPGDAPEYKNGPTVPPGCTKVEIDNRITTIPAPRVQPGSDAAKSFPKVDSTAQRARDDDRRKLLEGELQTQEGRLAALKAEYNNGEPERRGDERNYQKYLDRVKQLRDDIAATEENVASTKRELARLRN